MVAIKDRPIAGTACRAFFSFVCGPLGPYEFPGKSSKTIRTSDLSPLKNSGGPGIGTRISLPSMSVIFIPKNSVFFFFFGP